MQDSDPERRNLLVTSIAFIAYFYAGGSFTNSAVRLQVINAEFSNPLVLCIFAWILLFWFLYRYWQKHSGSFSDGFNSEIYDYYNKSYLMGYVSKKLGKPLIGDKEEGYHLNGLTRKGEPFGIKYIYASNVGRDSKTGRINSYSGVIGGRDEVIYFDDFIGFSLKLRAYIDCCFRHPSFSNYIIPYVIFFLALLGPVYAYAF